MRETSHAAHDVDVLIVGAGLSGVGAAAQLTRCRPGTSYVVLEARGAMGGTWDLFRYPGIRSDSDMFTLGYRFRPWRDNATFASGPQIRDYVVDTAREYGVDRHVRYHRRVVAAAWSSATARWTVTAEATDGGEATETFTCRFLYVCSGYYRYDHGYRPPFPGEERFTGPVVHPQEWPEDLDVAGRRVVVIGSGATAVTLVPALARIAAHVTMLQRSPTYVLSLPGRDVVADALRRVLPEQAAYPVIRWKNILLSSAQYQVSRRRPELMKKLIRKGEERMLPPGYPIDTHFAPRYQPWDQRLCLVPDGDLFRAIAAGRACVVTGEIETFTEHGIRTTGGEEVEADVVVTATGLTLLPVGGIALEVDGTAVSLPDTVTYKGMMLCGVPNVAFTVGYTNASWTLKADLVAEQVCRLLRHMDEHGYASCTPQPPPEDEPTEPLLSFAAGYVQRSLAALPRQGARAPWRVHQNYLRDVRLYRRGRIDAAMRFGRPPTRSPDAGAATGVAPATAATTG